MALVIIIVGDNKNKLKVQICESNPYRESLQKTGYFKN